ncbi:MAG: hypothetical protein GX945_02635 [Lentisphaerae bacterium]|nr:hypothetical protein [Lentisphaerota bacterium]
MKMLCPHCGNALPPEAVNVATDLALCPECGRANRASICVVEDEINQDLLRRPPPGTWLRQEGEEIVIGTTLRSKLAWLLGPSTAILLWSGMNIYNTHCSQIITDTYSSQIIPRRFDLFQLPFGIIVLLVTAVLVGITIYMIFGRQEWRLDENGGSGFNGVGCFGKRWRFTWKDLTRIHTHTLRHIRGGTSYWLVLEGTSPEVKVILPGRKDRQQFIVNAIRYYHQQWRRRE